MNIKRQGDTQRERQTDRQTDRETERETERQRERQRDIHECAVNLMYFVEQFFWLIRTELKLTKVIHSMTMFTHLIVALL